MFDIGRRAIALLCTLMLIVASVPVWVPTVDAQTTGGATAVPPNLPPNNPPGNDDITRPPGPTVLDDAIIPPSLPGGGPLELPPGSFVDRQVMITIPASAPPGTGQAIAQGQGFGVIREFNVNSLGLRALVLSLPGDLDIPSAVDFLLLIGGVNSAQPVYRHSLAAGPQYALDTLRVPAAHQYATGNQILVAVIDSGVDANHPALAGRVVGVTDFSGSGGRPDNHGTAVAGIIAGSGQVTGIAPGASILAVTAFSPQGGGGEGTSDRIVQAVDFAILSGADVINMSFSGPNDPLLNQTVQRAIAGGIVAVAAAGNGGPSSGPSWPAAIPGVIAVTATDPNDQLYGNATRGSFVSLAAPGVQVLCVTAGGGFGLLSGTSMAAAHVSGLAALILERNRGASPAQVLAILQASARDLGAPGRDAEFGYGRIDALGAVQGL